MKISYNILNTFFDGKLPEPSVLEEAFTFHSWEIEEVLEKEGDTVFDVKVLPDKSAWALSHRGIAKDLSVILGLPFVHDLFAHRPILEPMIEDLTISVGTQKCDTYTSAYVTGVTVGPSPEWLVRSLGVLGQRSVNNIVDATNYVMFLLGQPLHAFDAKKLGALSVGVRNAREGEIITTLTGESYTLTAHDAVIVDGSTDTPIGIAGIKGGKVAEVDQKTTDIVIESAHFDAVSVRKTAQRLKLRTDASMRYENGIDARVTTYALAEVVRIILEVAHGSLVGYVAVEASLPLHAEVAVSLEKINSVLGLSLSRDVVDGIIARFEYAYHWKEDLLTVRPPFERPDLVIPEDLIEEIGRVHGYDHVQSVTPSPLPLTEINQTFYYTDALRTALQDVGFSEVFTSSFREIDEVKLQNALASDKGYLRSTIAGNMREALARNAPNADLLGVKEVALFEMGIVFTTEGQKLALALGVSSSSGYKAKNDDKVLARGFEAVKSVLGSMPKWEGGAGVAETVLTNIFATLAKPSSYSSFVKTPDISYKTFSAYPFASRDVALWVPNHAGHGSEKVSEETLVALITKHASDLLVRLDLFDRFEKEGRVSYAFRLVFQSFERTLTADEINYLMKNVTEALESGGCIIR